MYRVSDGVRTTRNQDGGVALDIQNGSLFRLNPTGALILGLLAKGFGEADIAQEIARQYRISEDNAATDVGEFLQSLEEHHLVQRHHRGEGS
jgi:hypothetical protein